MIRRIRSALRAAIWLSLVGLISVGGAGLIVGLDPPPTDARRPELTARGDQRFARAAPSLRDAVGTLADEADALAAAARSASRAVRALDPAVARQQIRAGDTALVAIGIAAQRMVAERDGLVAEIGGAALGSTNQERLAAVRDAEATASTLLDAWSGVVSSVSAAVAILDALERHDVAIAEASDAADEELYLPALTSLDAAATQLAAIAALRDRLPQGTDTPGLDTWLARAADREAALRRLYGALLASDGQPTEATAAALREVEGAQAALPSGDDVLTSLATEIAEPQLTDALVAIERARGIVRDAEVALD